MTFRGDLLSSLNFAIGSGVSVSIILSLSFHIYNRELIINPVKSCSSHIPNFMEDVPPHLWFSQSLREVFGFRIDLFLRSFFFFSLSKNKVGLFQ